LKDSTIRPSSVSLICTSVPSSPFTVLLRTQKIATILLFQADAADKQDDRDNDEDYDSETDHRNVEDGCTLLNFRVWFQLTQELLGIFFVSFLLLICLPVLAFWFMLFGCLVTCFNVYMLLRRLWRDAHSDARAVAVLLNDDEED
jgi:hypothetical protein